MDIVILAVGKLKRDFRYLEPGIEEYGRRMRPYANISWVEIPDEPITASRPAEQVLAREGERILTQWERASVRVALCERGETLDSIAFARRLAAWRQGTAHHADPSNGGTRPPASGPMMMVIGGALGLSSSVLDAADWTVSLSSLTFPHPLVRLVLMEQLYRAFRIQRGEPYHK